MRTTLSKIRVKFSVVFLSLFGVCAFVACESQSAGGAKVRLSGGDGYLRTSVNDDDLGRAASEMIQEVIRSGRFVRGDGGRYTVRCGTVFDGTLQGVDTGRLMSGIRSTLAASGQVIVIDADDQDVGGKKRKNLLSFDYKNNSFSTLIEEDMVSVPELRVGGRIFHRMVRYDRLSDPHVEYYLLLEITNARTGLVFWSREASLGRKDA
ncbi:hypothetical protein [Geminisphaera colitermitum]|uniref:hypothetical protein n=1 Tax=Geminisphaera colitermitum TaxID=1148786 RepID=UPI0006940E92|nr:hypothetical protein [Geminisphaera colitermitum]